MKIESYKTEKLKVEKDLNEMTKKSDLISWIRVALFILIMGLLSYGYFKKIDIFYVFVAVLTIIFFVIVKLHSDIELKIKYKKSKIQVYQKYIKRYLLNIFLITANIYFTWFRTNLWSYYTISF